jgi:hypothetical protein
MKKKIDSKEIFGAEVQYFRLDPKYWETIVEKFRDSGLKCLTTYVQWSTHLVGEPDAKNPAGVLDFEGRTNPRLNLLRFLEIVGENGLSLNFRCGPFCCNEMIHGGYPPWLVLGDPNMMVWDCQNRTTQGYWIGKKEGSQPSYLHPEYLKWCEKWIAEVDKIVRPRLKSNGGFITMMNLDNEISYIVRDSFLDSDYNPVNVAPGGFYHQFLKEKYISTARIPYGKSYKNIEDIQPPRSVPHQINFDFPYYADWIEFKTWTMCRYIKALRKMHENNGVKDVIFMTNFNPHLPEGIPTRMPDFEKAVGEGGIVGYDFYRGAFMSYSGYHSMARVIKLMNASLKYSWAPEFMAGSWNKDMTSTSRISNEHTRFMARCALSQGCKAISWFMFHDRDCWGDAPLSSHGHTRPNYEVLKETVDIVSGKISGWDALSPICDVGIVYDLASHTHTSIGDPMPCNDNESYVGNPEIDGVKAGLASLEYYGLFRLVEQAGAQAAVIDPVCKPQNIPPFNLVFMPSSPVISKETSDLLSIYLKKGGTLLLTGHWPTKSGSGGDIKFLGINKPTKQGDVFRAKVGKGTLVWRKTFIAQEKPEEENPESVEFIWEIMSDGKIVPNVRITPAETAQWVDWQKGGGHKVYEQKRNLGSAILHESESEKILFVLNHYCEAAGFILEFADKKLLLITDIDSGDTVKIVNGKASVDIDRKTCKIYKVE